MTSRQTLCRDYSDGMSANVAVIRVNGLYRLASVAERLSPRQVILDRFVEAYPPQTKLRDALCDLSAYLQHDDDKRPSRRRARLSPFAISFAWLLLAYGAVQPETGLRLDVDPVRGLVGFIPELAGEIRFMGNQLLGCDPLLGEETLLDHLRGATALRGFLPDPAWFCLDRLQGEAGGTRYRFFFDAAASGSAERQRDRLAEILAHVTAQALSYTPLALEGSRALFERIWKMGWHTEGWQPVHIRSLFGAAPSVHYEHHLHESFERACALLATEGGAGRSV
jgi:hypothetical protein